MTGAGPGLETHRMPAQDPMRMPGGTVRITDTRNFPASKTISAALVDLEPAGSRELHGHPNGAEWQFYIQGHGDSENADRLTGLVWSVRRKLRSPISASSLNHSQPSHSDRKWFKQTPGKLVRTRTPMQITGPGCPDAVRPPTVPPLSGLELDEPNSAPHPRPAPARTREDAPADVAQSGPEPRE